MAVSDTRHTRENFSKERGRPENHIYTLVRLWTAETNYGRADMDSGQVQDP